MRKLYALIFVFCLSFFAFSQSIQFISSRTGDPLPDITVFNSSGDIVATSDIDGKILKKNLMPFTGDYTLYDKDYKIGVLQPQDVDNSLIKLNDKVYRIQPVVIQNQTNSKYLYLSGFFISFVTVNGKLTAYTDGEVISVFDNRSKKFQNDFVKQFRTYIIHNPEASETKALADNNQRSNLRIPSFEILGQYSATKQKDKTSDLLEFSRSDYDIVEWKEARFEDKEFKFLGYRVTDMKATNTLLYRKGSAKLLRDLHEISQEESSKLKHKSETDYNNMVVYSYFYPQKITFGDERKLEGVRFITAWSDYETKYWEQEGFPDKKKVFDSFFAKNLVLLQNIRTP